MSGWEPPIGWTPEDPPIPGVTLVPPEALKVPQGGAQGVLDRLLAEAHECAGGCSTQVIPQVAWTRIPIPHRKVLRRSGVRRVESLGRCLKCTTAGRPGDLNAGRGKHANRRRKLDQETINRLPEIWEAITADGGGTQELGKHLGVTRERARQLVKKLGLPKRDRRGAATREFIEELEWFAGFGLGAHEIAQKFGMTADALVRRIDRLRARGLTTVSFPTYFRYYEKEDAA